jgi:signal transduction histidine kinase
MGVASSIARLSVARNPSADSEGLGPLATSSKGRGESTSLHKASQEVSLDSFPCVLYECNRAMELTFITSNIFDLIGFEARELIGNRAFWDERIIADDLGLVRQKLGELQNLGSISMTHRLLDRRGVPVWVSHSLQSIPKADGDIFRGCLLRGAKEAAVQESSQGAVDLFVHKIGNHFQLLRLVVSSLKKVLPESRETEVLNQTVDSAIELARSFSDYNQTPSSWSTTVGMIDVIEAASARLKPEFLEKGVLFENQVDPSVREVSVAGDPFLLELALSHILQNALEATSKGGTVTLRAGAESERSAAPVVKISVIDSGCGIEGKTVERIFSPFFTTREGHYGLGLSTAHRFVTMHSGLVEVRSTVNEGTEVKIMLPAVALKGLSRE